MLKAGLEEIKNSETTKIIADDHAFEKDVSMWCNLIRNGLLFLKKDKKRLSQLM